MRWRGPVLSAWRGVFAHCLVQQCLLARVHVRARGVLCNFRAQSCKFRRGDVSFFFLFFFVFTSSEAVSPLAEALHCQKQQQQQSSSFVTFCNLFTVPQSDTRTPGFETRFGNGKSNSKKKQQKAATAAEAEYTQLLCHQQTRSSIAAKVNASDRGKKTKKPRREGKERETRMKAAKETNRHWHTMNAFEHRTAFTARARKATCQEELFQPETR